MTFNALLIANATILMSETTNYTVKGNCATKKTYRVKLGTKSKPPKQGRYLGEATGGYPAPKECMSVITDQT